MQARTTVGLILGVLVALGGAVAASAGIVPETLQDGTKVEIDGDKLYVVRAGDGSVKPADKARKPLRTLAADGTYKMKNGKLLPPAR